MVVCDLCATPGTGTFVSSEDMRKAVFKKGFDPYALDLALSFGAPKKFMFENWKNTVVAQDTSDWNICTRCMSRLAPFLEGKPKPTGINKSTVSTHPVVGQLVAKEVEDKYKRKKRWQFWKK